MWAMSGLEQASFALLLLLAVYPLTAPDEINKLTLSLALSGLVLSRPEGIAVALLFLGTLVMWPMPESSWHQRLKSLGGPIACVIVTAAALIAFRMWYFGYPMPNTVYAKFSSAFPSWLRVLQWLLFVSPFIVASIVALRRIADSRIRRILVTTLVVVLSHTAMVLPVSTVMSFEHRYHIAFLPLLLMAVPSLVQAVWTWRRAAGVALLTLLFLWPIQGLPGVRQLLTWERDRMVSQHCIAEHLAALPGNPTVALQDAGRIPYWRELQYIDAWGLCDVEFARSEYSPLELLKRRPNVYVMSADSIIGGYASPRLGMDNMMYSVVGFAQQYRLWNHCVFSPRQANDAYHYAILLDVFWASKMGVRIPEAEEFKE
jgi:hypothetical protein